jgi:hypothetical protein
MLRRIVLAIGIAVLPIAALAAPSPAPSPSSSGAVRDGGSFVGRLTAVDYQQNMIGVDTVGRGHIDVAVMPTTSIQGKDAGYRAITDLKAGQRVKVFSSVADGKYVAQIIQIR